MCSNATEVATTQDVSCAGSNFPGVTSWTLWQAGKLSSLLGFDHVYVLLPGIQQAPKAWSLLVPCFNTEAVGKFGGGT